MEQEKTPSSNDPKGPDRREFLKKCGKFAAVTPPAITMLLSTSLTSDAIAKSGGGGGKGRGSGRGKHFGWGYGGPGKSPLHKWFGRW